MKPRYSYVMRDQVRDRVASIMAHELRYGHGGGAIGRAHWLALLALVAYTAVLSLA
jgi:hypothetical protein